LPEPGGKESLIVYWKVEDSGKNAEDEAAHADNKVPRRILLRHYLVWCPQIVFDRNSGRHRGSIFA
jgi:hypothetical protein